MNPYQATSDAEKPRERESRAPQLAVIAGGLMIGYCMVSFAIQGFGVSSSRGVNGIGNFVSVSISTYFWVRVLLLIVGAGLTLLAWKMHVRQKLPDELSRANKH